MTIIAPGSRDAVRSVFFNVHDGVTKALVPPILVEVVLGEIGVRLFHIIVAPLCPVSRVKLRFSSHFFKRGERSFVFFQLDPLVDDTGWAQSILGGVKIHLMPIGP